MYDIRIVSSNGNSVQLGHAKSRYKLTDVSGLDSVLVSFSKQSGYGQVGVVHSAPTVGGRVLTITGRVDGFRRSDISNLDMVITPFGSVRLYFEERYFIDCTVSKTVGLAPSLSSVVFTFELSAAHPWWQSVDKEVMNLGGIIGGFNFPISYAGTHNFAVFSESLFINCINAGTVSTFFDLEIWMRAGSVNTVTIRNAMTQEFLRINTIITADDIVRIYREDGVLRAIKETNGVPADIFALIDEDSNLFELTPGDNVLSATAATGDRSNLMVTASYHSPATGVYYGI